MIITSLIASSISFLPCLLIVASNIVEQAEDLARKFQNACATSLDVHSEDNLNKLVSDHELVVRYVIKKIKK